jgi:hypothetical protein
MRPIDFRRPFVRLDRSLNRQCECKCVPACARCVPRRVRAPPVPSRQRALGLLKLPPNGCSSEPLQWSGSRFNTDSNVATISPCQLGCHPMPESQGCRFVDSARVARQTSRTAPHLPHRRGILPPLSSGQSWIRRKCSPSPECMPARWATRLRTDPRPSAPHHARACNHRLRIVVVRPHCLSHPSKPSQALGRVPRVGTIVPLRRG